MLKIGVLFTTALAFIGNVSAQLKSFNLDDIFKKNTFAMKFAPGFNVMADGKSYSVQEANGASWKLNRYSLETGTLVETLFSGESLTDITPPESYEFSSDETHLLVTRNTERIYRHSTKANAFVIDIAKKEMVEIPGGQVMYPTISPDNKNVAYVRDNNLFIFNLVSKKETAVTNDGKINEIINGGVDWVYEEEFSMSQGFEWNTNGKFLAYYKFDESKVKQFSMDMWGSLYPEQEVWKYPKAGEDNSKVDVFIFNTESNNSVQCKTGSENDQYLPRIKWTQDANILSVQRLNRKQNHWELLFFETTTAAEKSTVVRDETSNTYIDINDNLYFIKGTTQILYTSEKNGYNHLYCFDYKKGKEQQITNGNWDVVAMAAVNELLETIYYTSSEISPIEDHLYSIKFNGKNKTLLTPEPGNHNISFGGGNLYYTDMSSSFASPYVFTLKKAGSDSSRVLENNQALIDKFKEYDLGKTEFGKLTTASNNELNYWMIKPPNFDPQKKYPVFMHVYGGPGHNTVRNSYGGRNFLWHQYLASIGYIVISVDNRGTGNRGKEFKHSTYLQLGKLELQDQTEAAKWIGKQPWADASRIGIWGWSFGGYMSSLCISKSADVFKTAIAVAPVTNWRFYDNIYTERFLQKPQDNATGYDENSPINFVNGIKGNYLIVHGTGDDNVHFQNSVEMVNAMIKAGVNFDSEFYPNRNHGIGDRAAQYHLYKRMTDFVIQKL
ncbi:MAG: S9 family peptidase [Bacteroidia bacterium]|nr:S9 family peptidase [Bacteroidia bacterium]